VAKASFQQLYQLRENYDSLTLTRMKELRTVERPGSLDTQKTYDDCMDLLKEAIARKEHAFEVLSKVPTTTKIDSEKSKDWEKLKTFILTLLFGLLSTLIVIQLAKHYPSLFDK
jgi:hypothetical protein